MALAKHTVIKIAGTAITGVTELSWDGVSWDTEETTNHDAATPVRTSVPTLYTNGNIGLVLTFDHTNTQHALLRTHSTTGAVAEFQMIQVDGGEDVEFDGFVTGFNFDTPVDGLLKANVTIMVDGAFE